MDKNKLANLVKICKSYDLGIDQNDCLALFNALTQAHVYLYNSPKFLKDDWDTSLVFKYFATVVKLVDATNVGDEILNECVATTIDNLDMSKNEPHGALPLKLIELLNDIAKYIESGFNSDLYIYYCVSLISLTSTLIICYEHHTELNFLNGLENELIHLGFIKHKNRGE